jgi:RNA polymerase sigma factor (sigma-70 family)
MDRGAEDQEMQLPDLLAQLDWVRRLARHLAGQGCEDLAHDAWLAARAGAPDPARPLRPWLAQIVRNLGSVGRRKEGRRRAREQAYGGLAPARGAAVDEIYERLELDRFVAAAVADLDEPLRTVVVLRYFEGLDSQAIAAAIGAPAGTVRWRLKQAIERLRERLDERHGGNRQAWIAVFAPVEFAKETGKAAATAMEALMTTSAKKTSLGLATMLLLAVAMVLVCAWIWDAGSGFAARAVSPGGSAQVAIDRHSDASAAAPMRARPPRLLSAAEGETSEEKLETSLSGCQDALERARALARERENEARALVPQVAFELGAPNSRLRARVMPQIDRLLASPDGEPELSHDAECRDWACRITIVIPAVDSNEVEPRLAAMRQWVPRVMRLHRLSMGNTTPGEIAFSLGGRRSNRDPVTGATLEEFVFFVGDPSGAAPISDGDVVARPLPAVLEECHRQLASSRERTARRLAQLAGFQPAQARYAQSPSTPALTESVRRVAEKSFGSGQVRVDCRARICRLEFDQTPPAGALDRLRDAAVGDDPNLRGVREQDDVKTETVGNNMYVTLPSEGSYSFLRRVRRPMRDAAFWAGCPQPERAGNVLVRIMVPGPGESNEDGVYRRVSAKLIAGTLATTPAAACLTERLAALVAAEELPDPIGNLMRFESWAWEPGKPPVMVTAPGL